MEAKYELIKYPDEIRIQYHHMNFIRAEAHWHGELELLFVFSGSLTLIIDGRPLSLHAREFALINSGQIHSCESMEEENGEIALLQINNQFFADLNIDLEHTTYPNLYSSENHSPHYCPDCAKVLSLAREIYEILGEKKADYKSKLNLACCNIMFYLNSYSTIEQAGAASIQTNVARIKHVLNYLEAHYREEISCAALAEHEHISVYYLSRCFKKYTNTTITKYLNYYRISKIQHDLKHTEDSITEIYLRHGFNNSKTFNRTFREIADCSPSQWRKRELSHQKQLSLQNAENEIIDTGIGTYINFTPPTDTVSRKYLAADATESQQLHDSILASASVSLGNLHKSYNILTGTGRAHDFLKAGFQRQFQEIFSHFSFSYVRFFGIFNREMDVIRIVNGVPCYNFFYIDEVLDFLLENHCRPYLVLGFMPEDLRSSDETLYFYRAYTSPPKLASLWEELIRAFMEHVLERYSPQEVQHWIFEIWNEPDIDFWSGTYEEYLELYALTVRTLRAFPLKLTIGGAAFSNYAFERYDTLDAFLSFCEREDVLPDYLALHPYPVTLKLQKENSVIVQQMLGKDYLTESLSAMKAHLKQLGYGSLPLHLNEWNSTPGIDDYVHDTAFMAPFLIENIVKNCNQADILAYWCLSDLIDEKGVPAREFCGSFGFLTRSGIRKPSFYAFEALTHLSSRILAKGDDYLITGEKEQLQILLWNYCHYNQAFCDGDKSRLLYYDRYGIFEPSAVREYHLTLTDLNASHCRIALTQFDREHGSAFDFWLQNGAPEYFSKDQLRFYQEQIHPARSQEYRTIEKGTLTLHTFVEPFGFTLYEITLLPPAGKLC